MPLEADANMHVKTRSNVMTFEALPKKMKLNVLAYQMVAGYHYSHGLTYSRESYNSASAS